MTFSSSDGWPLTGPNVSVRRAPLTSVPSTNMSSSSADARPPPTCTCSGAARRPSGRRSPSVVDDRDRQEQPDELDLGEAQARRRRRAASTRSCGSRSISSSADPAEQADGRQQDLVGPPAGEHLGEVGDEQRAEVDGAGRAAAAQATTARLTVGPEREAADEQRDRDEARAAATSCQRGRGRIGPRIPADGRGTRRAGAVRRPSRSCHQRSRPLEPEPDLADLDSSPNPSDATPVDAAGR